MAGEPLQFVMAKEAFETKMMFRDPQLECIMCTILILVSLKSFEYIIKTVLTSSPRDSVNTAKYALQIAADQAYNPLNYIRWWRGRSDFDHEDDDMKPELIPLDRVAMAVFMCRLVLYVEAAFFYGTMLETRDLTNEQIHISVEITHKHNPRPLL